MKKKDLNDLRNRTAAEIDSMVAKTKEEIVKAKMEIASKKSKNLNIAKNLRKNLAQMLTIRKELK
jgi:ribosomal protein L29